MVDINVIQEPCEIQAMIEELEKLHTNLIEKYEQYRNDINPHSLLDELTYQVSINYKWSIRVLIGVLHLKELIPYNGCSEEFLQIALDEGYIDKYDVWVKYYIDDDLERNNILALGGGNMPVFANSLIELQQVLINNLKIKHSNI